MKRLHSSLARSIGIESQVKQPSQTHDDGRKLFAGNPFVALATTEGSSSIRTSIKKLQGHPGTANQSRAFLQKTVLEEPSNTAEELHSWMISKYKPEIPVHPRLSSACAYCR